MYVITNYKSWMCAYYMPLCVLLKKVWDTLKGNLYTCIYFCLNIIYYCCMLTSADVDKPVYQGIVKLYSSQFICVCTCIAMDYWVIF